MVTAVTIACQLPTMLQTESQPEVPEFELPEKGFVRANPLPIGEPIQTANWTIEVLEFSRGQAAWEQLKAVSYGNNQPPAIGEEYVLLNIRITHNNKRADTESIGISLTGSAGVRYYSFNSQLSPPSPYLKSDVAGGSSEEGWYAFVIEEGETDLMLVIDEYATSDEPLTYAALEEGASILVPNELSAIQPTSRGKPIQEPAPIGSTVTNEDWELTITDVIVGDEAWETLFAANKFNDPPPPGIIYILVKANVRYIGQDDEPKYMNGYYLKLLGESGTLYDTPPLVEPRPWFEFAFFPGGEAEGWLAVAGSQDETEYMLRFNPLYNDDNPGIRYLSLDTTGR